MDVTYLLRGRWFYLWRALHVHIRFRFRFFFSCDPSARNQVFFYFVFFEYIIFSYKGIGRARLLLPPFVSHAHAQFEQISRGCLEFERGASLFVSGIGREPVVRGETPSRFCAVLWHSLSFARSHGSLWRWKNRHIMTLQ